MTTQIPSKTRLWTGRVMTGLVTLFLLFDAGWKLFGTLPAAASQRMAHS